MPAEQFSAAVRGSAGSPLQTTAVGSIQTDNYEHGDAFEFGGSNYPYTVDPNNLDVIQEIMLSEAGDIDMEIHTVAGDTFPVRLASTVGRWQIWEIDQIVFKDPRNTQSKLYGAVGGE